MVPEPDKLASVPLVTATSPPTKPVTASENVTVNRMGEVVAVLPDAPTDELILAVGATASTRMPASEGTPLSVSVALLPVTSRKMPLFNDRAPSVMPSPSSSLFCTV